MQNSYVDGPRVQGLWRRFWRPGRVRSWGPRKTARTPAKRPARQSTSSGPRTMTPTQKPLSKSPPGTREDRGRGQAAASRKREGRGTVLDLPPAEPEWPRRLSPRPNVAKSVDRRPSPARAGHGIGDRRDARALALRQARRESETARRTRAFRSRQISVSLMSQASIRHDAALPGPRIHDPWRSNIPAVKIAKRPSLQRRITHCHLAKTPDAR